MEKLILSVLFFSIVVSVTKAQELKNNSYLPEDFEYLKEYIENAHQSRLNKISGGNSRKIKKIFKGLDKKRIEAIEDSTFVFNSTIQKNLQEIINNIYKANPELEKENYLFFIKNSNIPNAASYGDGTFEINLGLLNSLNDDDELAFIICHEISHQILEHSLKSITKRIDDLNSEETKKKIKEIQNIEFGRNKAGRLLLDELNIDILDHSKAAEEEADSLGFVMFSKTIYNEAAAVSALRKLKKNDEMIFYQDIKIDSVFNIKTYPFNSLWLKEEISLFDSDKRINEFALSSDTLKTHPELSHRIEKISKNIDFKDIDEFTKNENLNLIKEMTIPHSIEFTLDLNLLDLALYNLVVNYNSGKITENYYHTQFYKFLKSIYKAKKNHKLGKFVPQKDSYSDEKILNKIRLFLHNLELNDIKEIALAFCEQNKSKISISESNIPCVEFD